MKTFKKWNGRAVEEGYTCMTKDAKSFVTAFKNMLKRELAGSGIKVVNITPGHYDLSGFLMRNGQYVYVSYSIPRYGERIDFDRSGAMHGVLYRTATGPKDYTGGPNNFCSIFELPQALCRMFNRMEVAA